MSICLNQAGETKTNHCPPTLRPPSIQFKWYLSYRPDICPENHELYLWGKNCHVEKFQLSMYDNCGEIEIFSTCGEIQMSFISLRWLNLAWTSTSTRSSYKPSTPPHTRSPLQVWACQLRRWWERSSKYYFDFCHSKFPYFLEDFP